MPVALTTEQFEGDYVPLTARRLRNAIEPLKRAATCVRIRRPRHTLSHPRLGHDARLCGDVYGG